MEAFSAERDWDCWLDPQAILFGGAFPVAPAAIARASWAAGSAASQLVEAEAVQSRVGQAYPADRHCLLVRLELPLLRPDSLEVAAVPVFQVPLRVRP